MKEDAGRSVPAISGDYECRRKPYADHCLCQSCCKVRRRQSSPEPRYGSPPPVEDDENASDCTSTEINQSCDEETDECDNQTPEEEDEEVKEGPRMIRSAHSIFASDPAASRRPIICPLDACRRHIAVNTLVSHFSFEHPEVLRIDLNRSTPTLAVRIPRFHNLVPMTTECVAILRVAGEDEEKGLVADMWKLVLAYTVMHDGGFMAWVFGLLESDQELTARLAMEQEGNWFSGESGDCEELDVDSRKTDPSSSSALQARSISFTGPVAPLRESQEPLDVLARGDCLYVPPGLVESFCFAPQGMVLQLTIAL